MLTCTSTADLVYGEIDGIQLHADIHRPDLPGEVPTVVYVHGGGWAVGDRKDFLESRLLPLARRGVAVVSVQYRLTDVAAFPAQLLDVRAAVRWLRLVGADHGLDVRRIGSWGSSAGAMLAALLGLEQHLDDDGRPLSSPGARCTDAVVSWSGPLDVAEMFTRSWLEAEELPLAGSEAALLLGADAYDRDDPRHRAADPLRLVTAGAAPFVLVCGDRDHMVPAGSSQRVHDRLVSENVASALLTIGGAGHEDVALESAPVFDLMAAHFKRHLVEAEAEADTASVPRSTTEGQPA
jgi:acetyl esterase/lipase